MVPKALSSPTRKGEKEQGGSAWLSEKTSWLLGSWVGNSIVSSASESLAASARTPEAGPQNRVSLLRHYRHCEPHSSVVGAVPYLLVCLWALLAHLLYCLPAGLVSPPAPKWQRCFQTVLYAVLPEYTDLPGWYMGTAVREWASVLFHMSKLTAQLPHSIKARSQKGNLEHGRAQPVPEKPGDF